MPERTQDGLEAVLVDTVAPGKTRRGQEDYSQKAGQTATPETKSHSLDLGPQVTTEEDAPRLTMATIVRTASKAQSEYENYKDTVYFDS